MTNALLNKKLNDLKNVGFFNNLIIERGIEKEFFRVDKDGNIISTTVLPTSKLTTINLTKEDQSFIEKDCKEKFKFSSGSGNDRFVLKMKYAKL